MHAIQILWVQWKKATLIALALLAFIGAFWLIPYDLGDDWNTFKGSAMHILQGESLYSNPVNSLYYSNPPWVAVVLLPLGLLPAKLGWAILSCLTLLALFFLARRFHLPPLKLGLLVLSPPVIYTLIHGQIDVLVLAAFLLPSEWRPVVAITKPQVSLGLLFNSELTNWKRTLLVTGAVLAASLIFFADWPLQLIRQPAPFVIARHNYLSNTWPLLVPIAVGLVLAGIRKKDLRYFMAASPFFSPYAAVSSLIGVWFAACSVLETWQAAVVMASWWVVSIYTTLR